MGRLVRLSSRSFSRASAANSAAAHFHATVVPASFRQICHFLFKLPGARESWAKHHTDRGSWEAIYLSTC
jgi:hypothetical protein